MIQPTMINSKDSKIKELEQLKREKALIDDRAEKLVNVELWCGLGLLAIQTLGFMRLTFWELSWDVMEPVCFYVTSFYFMAGYAFFLRTSRDPSFEGFFESRFASKQKKLMKKHNFDLQRFNKLKLEIGGQLHSRTLQASYNCRHQSHLIGHVQDL
jgi:calcium uniporter protein, mitochondrial